MANLTERADAVADLSSVDGAVLMTTTLEVLGFGATLTAPRWSGKVVVGHDGFAPNGQDFPIEKLGTRHTSGVAFAAHHPGTFVFVLSSDGPVRAFTSDGATVCCWLDMRATMSSWKEG